MITRYPAATVAQMRYYRNNSDYSCIEFSWYMLMKRAVDSSDL